MITNKFIARSDFIYKEAAVVFLVKITKIEQTLLLILLLKIKKYVNIHKGF